MQNFTYVHKVLFSFSDMIDPSSANISVLFINSSSIVFGFSMRDEYDAVPPVQVTYSAIPIPHSRCGSLASVLKQPSSVSCSFPCHLFGLQPSTFYNLTVTELWNGTSTSKVVQTAADGMSLLALIFFKTYSSLGAWKFHPN